MKQNFDKLIAFFNENDRFAKFNGMKIIHLSEGFCIAEMHLQEFHLNGVGIVMGGCFFTLSDFVAAAAMNSFGVMGVTQSANISFLQPGKGNLGDIFRAEASLLNKTRHTVVLNVDVLNMENKLLCRSLISGFLKDVPFPVEQ